MSSQPMMKAEIVFEIIPVGSPDRRSRTPHRGLPEHWPSEGCLPPSTAASVGGNGRRVRVVRRLDEHERFGLAVGNDVPRPRT
jgi:hypothetical protein